MIKFKKGDAVINIFTKEVGVVTKVRKDGLIMVRYDSFTDDPQQLSWVRPHRR